MFIKPKKTLIFFALSATFILGGCSRNLNETSKNLNSNSSQSIYTSSPTSISNSTNSSSSSSSTIEPEIYYTYRFYDAYNTIIKQDRILEGNPIIPPDELPTKKKTDQYSFTFLKWTCDDFSSIHQDMDIYPIYSEIINQYTYTFFNYDDSVLKTTTADYGTEIIAPQNPTYEDDNYFYTFIGWNQEFSILTQDIQIKALYTKVKTYTYRFYDANGNVMKEERVEEGSFITPPTDTPTKDATAQYSYSFKKWTVDDFSTIHENLDIYPIFNETLNQYTYTFLNYDDSILKQVTAEYGTTIVAPKNPTYQEENNEYNYVFVKWDKSFDILTGDITIKAVYVKQTNYQVQALNIIRSAFSNNKVVTLDASLIGDATMDIQLQFSMKEAIIEDLINQKVLSVEELLQSVTLKAILNYQNELILVEINQEQSYVSAFGKVFAFDLLKTYQKLLNVLPKEVFDVVEFLNNFLSQTPSIENIEVVYQENKAHISVEIKNTFQEGNGEVVGNTNPFYGKNFICEADFEKVNEEYFFNFAEMTILYEKITAQVSSNEFIFEIDYTSSLNWFDHLIALADPISLTAQLKDFHINGNISLSALSGAYKASVGFEIQISLDENNKVKGYFKIDVKKDAVRQIFKGDATSLIYLDEANDRVYLNCTYNQKKGLFSKEETINEKKCFTTQQFNEDIANNIFYILNAADTVKNNADATATIDFKNIIKDFTSNEEHTSFNIIIDKTAITLVKEGSNLSVSEDFNISLGINENGYISNIAVTGGVAMSGLTLTISATDISLIDIGQSLNVNELIQNALNEGTIVDTI